MKKKTITLNHRPAAWARLKDWCIFSQTEDEYVEVTEWTNGEGYDIIIQKNKQNTNSSSTNVSSINISLTNGDFKAIKECIKKINQTEK